MIIRIVFIFIFSLLFNSNLFSQNDSVVNDSIMFLNSVLVDGQTIPHSDIKEVVVFPPHKFKRRRHRRRYRKLVRDIKKVYPYAKLAKKKFDKMEKEFSKLETEKEKRKYVKSVEQELKDEFGEKLKHLTITQGRLLLKLLDREIGSTSYVLLKELRGSFSAVFWQTIARLFGSDLKQEYDPHGQDYLIERIVLEIQYGYL
ncbi:MAG: DUF4294 domain-containing protein [Bacteroidota bacterium]|nr:DUF4294 domain-containing protein [Bacteroidota bacterium]